MFTQHKETKRPYMSGVERATFLNGLLDYLRAHDGEVVDLTHMAEELGTNYQVVYRGVSDLRERNAVRRIGKHGHFKYRVRVATVRARRGGSAKKTTKVAEVQTPAAKVAPTETPSTGKIGSSDIESLIWEYVKATRNTDLLVFLSWLESRK